MEWLNWHKAKQSASARRKDRGAAWRSKCVPGTLRPITTLKIAILLCVLPVAAVAGCSQDHVDLRWDGGNVRFNVEVVDDPQERAQGLMFREHLPRYGGMLFVFEQAQQVAFWMKNTLIPLDMIFLDETGVVQNIHENAVPGSLESIPGKGKILAVLEINGGLSSKLGLVAGAETRHPSFARTVPAWPCR